MSEYNPMQRVKRRMFAMRNGAVAERLRSLRVPYRIIFGLNLPQIIEIAAGTEPSVELAEQLWANTQTRESLLLAPMIYPRGQMDQSTAIRWASTAVSPEVVDVLCHRLLRHLDCADAVADAMWASERPLDRYCALRLMFNLFPRRADLIEERSRAELGRSEPLTASLCRMIVDEVEFLKEDSN